jgi:sugar/nucleoside kinase (ribokinase family)
MNLRGVTQPSEFFQTLGGVARNMSECLIRMGIADTHLLSALANDTAGRFICNESERIGLDSSKWLILDKRVASTGSYCGVFDTTGDLAIAYGAMRAHEFVSTEYIEKHIDLIESADICVLDADIPIETIEYICRICKSTGVPVWFNPTDLRKCNKIIEANSLSKITYMSPNMKELFTLFRATLIQDKNIKDYQSLKEICEKYSSSLDEIEQQDISTILSYMLRYIPFIVLSRGSSDLILASAYDLPNDKGNHMPTRSNQHDFHSKSKFRPNLTFYPVVDLKEYEKLINVTGAGDSCTSGIIAGILKNYELNSAIYNGLLSAKYALMTQENVNKDINLLNLEQVQENVAKYQSRIKKVYLN